jgi:hypothetical protein
MLWLKLELLNFKYNEAPKILPNEASMKSAYVSSFDSISASYQFLVFDEPYC